MALSPIESWNAFADTQRLNRAAGMGPRTFEPAQEHGQFSNRVTLRALGLALSWIEPPYEWCVGRYSRGVLLFDGTPFSRMEAQLEVEPDAAGTRVRLRSKLWPRGLLGRLLAPLAARTMLAAAGFLVKKGGQRGSSGRTPYAPRRLRSRTKIRALAKGLQKLKELGAPPSMASRLEILLREGFDDELASMRPFELADQWELDRYGTLKLFLQAVKAGLVDLRWDVMCPNCQAAKLTAKGLSELKDKAHCATCRIGFDSDLASNVEARFSVHPSIRRADHATYCVGSPSNTPFAAAQANLEAGSQKEIEIELQSESYCVRALREGLQWKLRPSEGGRSRLSLVDGQSELLFVPGTVTIELPKTSAADLIRIEKESWREKSATAAAITVFQPFRDLFSAEVLAPGVEIAVRNLAILFSDLKGSTEMYEKAGDAPAYVFVRDHFEFMRRILERYKGGIVKTIGDAVMAGFRDAAEAVAACIEIQERSGELLKKTPGDTALKLGVHQGACIAIQSNGQLDYFGSTVNIAARTQSESHGGDIVVTDAVASDPAVRRLIEKRSVPAERFEADLKGIHARQVLWRLTPSKR